MIANSFFFYNSANSSFSKTSLFINPLCEFLYSILPSFFTVISLGALPITTYASNPTPTNKLTKTIEMSKQSPFCHFSTLSGDGIIDGYK